MVADFLFFSNILLCNTKSMIKTIYEYSVKANTYFARARAQARVRNTFLARARARILMTRLRIKAYL